MDFIEKQGKPYGLIVKFYANCALHQEVLKMPRMSGGYI